MNYVEDLVQEIYTKCDTSGLDKLNKSTQFAIFQTEALGKNLAAIQAMQKSGYSEIAKNLKSSVSSIGALNQGIRFANKENLKGIDLTKQTYLGKKYQIGIEAALNNERIKTAFLEDKYNRQRKKWQEADMRRTQRQTWLQRNLGRLFVATLGFQAIKGVVDTASRIQLVQKSIEGLTKSTQDWEFIKTQAFEKGIDLEVVAKGYRNFYSSAKMAGFDKGGIQQMYADMLLSTRAIGATTQQTEGALLALEQMISKGTVSMEELRRQLGNALPGAFEIGAKAMNMTTAEFNAFVKTGKLASTEFVPKFIKQLKTEYAGGFKDVAETMSFATTRLSVAWKLFQTKMFEGESGKSFARAIDTLAKLMISPEFERVAEAIGKIFEITAKLLKFAIDNIATTIALLGSAGLTQVMVKLAWAIETKGVVAVMKLAKATALLYGQWLLVFGLVAAIQDLIYGIFLPNYTDSITERILKKLGLYKEDDHVPTAKETNADIQAMRKKQLTSGMYDPKSDSILYMDNNGVMRLLSQKDYVKVTRGYKFNDPNAGSTQYWLQEAQRMGYSGAAVKPNKYFPQGGLSPIEMQKTETKALTMGDVNIYVQGNKDPSTTAQAVYDSFFTLRSKFFQGK